jgi:hypothetical protein
MRGIHDRREVEWRVREMCVEALPRARYGLPKRDEFDKSGQTEAESGFASPLGTFPDSSIHRFTMRVFPPGADPRGLSWRSDHEDPISARVRAVLDLMSSMAWGEKFNLVGISVL